MCITHSWEEGAMHINAIQLEVQQHLVAVGLLCHLHSADLCAASTSTETNTNKHTYIHTRKYMHTHTIQLEVQHLVAAGVLRQQHKLPTNFIHAEHPSPTPLEPLPCFQIYFPSPTPPPSDTLLVWGLPPEIFSTKRVQTFKK